MNLMTYEVRFYLTNPVLAVNMYILIMVNTVNFAEELK